MSQSRLTRIAAVATKIETTARILRCARRDPRRSIGLKNRSLNRGKNQKNARQAANANALKSSPASKKERMFRDSAFNQP